MRQVTHEPATEPVSTLAEDQKAFLNVDKDGAHDPGWGKDSAELPAPWIPASLARREMTGLDDEVKQLW